MGFDDIHNTGLVLGLGLSSDVHRHDQFEKRSEPSLTLTLSADQSIGHVYLQPQDSGGVSSPCRGSLKRERMASRFCNEDDDDSNGRKKLRLTKAQSALLEESFKQHSTLNPKHKQELAKELKLRPRQVEVWFQNRRARTKLKKTEVDCEQLKKCFETLTEENRMLQKELQKLKSLNFPPPLYMKLPAATLTMCPSCERVGGATAGVGDNGSKSKPHFYNPLTNPSTAC